MSNTKAVLGVLEGVMQMPKESQKTSLDFMAYVMRNGKGIVDVITNERSRNALLMTVERMASLQPEDRDEVCKFLSSTVAAPVVSVPTGETILPVKVVDEGTTSPSLRGGVRRGMMEKARQFLGSLPQGTTVSPISICKRAGINPANMYQFCKSLAKQGVIRQVAKAKYKILSKGQDVAGMSLIRQVASMKGGRVRIQGALSPRTYIEKLPVKESFKIGAMKETCNIPWNHVTAYVSALMKKGMIKRTSRGVYVKVKEG